MLTKNSKFKKALSLLLAFVMSFTAFAFCLPELEAEAISVQGKNTFKYGDYYSYEKGTEFVSEIVIQGSSEEADAISWLTDRGYSYDPLDLNKGCGKDSNYIYIGWKTSTDINDAVATWMIGRHETASGLNSATYSVKVPGTDITSTFTGATNGEYVYDLNQAAKKCDWIYLYYVDNPQLGLPITSITVSNTDSEAYHYTVTDENGKASDANAQNDNAGPGGEDSNYPSIYIHFGDYEPWVNVTSEINALQAAVNNALTVADASYYTEESYNTALNAYYKAAEILTVFDNDYNAGYYSSAEITAATTALNNAVNALETTVTLNANGGTLKGDTTTVEITCGTNREVTFYATAYTATKDGYSFLGWNTDPNATSGFKSAMTVPLKSTVYAIYAGISYTVYFINPIDNSTIARQTVANGGAATEPDVDEYITKDKDVHYHFTGWDADFSNITEQTTVNAIYEEVTHNYELSKTVDPTCSATGSETYVCKDCGEEKVVTIGENPDNHTNTVKTKESPSTCQQHGTSSGVFCNDCLTWVVEKTTLPLADCTYPDEWTVTDPTCDEDGSKSRACTVCGKVDSTTIPATGHSWSDWNVTLAPGCSTEGKQTRTCSVCDETEVEIIEPTGHSYTDNVTAPTCTQQGYTTKTCSDCGDVTVTDYVAATGHNWEALQVTKNATCTEKGSMSAYCDKCQTTQHNIEIPALGHDWDEDSITVTQEATCTVNGLMDAYCNRCYTTYHNIVIPANGHNWDRGYVLSKPTCDKEGSIIYTCGTCNTTKSEPIATLSHKYLGVVTPPTCTEQGFTTYTCKVCNTVTVSDYVPATGHSYTILVVPPSCTSQGYTVNVCTAGCGDATRSDFVEPTGHSYKETVVAPTCNEKGYTLHECSVCKDSFKDNETDSLGHSYETTTIAPTCSRDGFDLHSCERCDNSYKDNYVDAIGHNYIQTGVVAPTQTQYGYYIHTCDNCDKIFKEIIFTGNRALVCVTLYDSKGNIVPEAKITVTNTTTGESYVIYSDLNGYFTEVLAEGNYELLIDKNGYDDTYGYITVAGGKAEVNIPTVQDLDCDCICHEDSVWAQIWRIIVKIFTGLGIKIGCCADPQI